MMHTMKDEDIGRKFMIMKPGIALDYNWCVMSEWENRSSRIEAGVAHTLST